ncbi:MAG: LCP family protein, partial [Coriobacteriales bacterium]|nr:LCP family protein [Coriobacteriales bacterium]
MASEETVHQDGVRHPDRTPYPDGAQHPAAARHTGDARRSNRVAGQARTASQVRGHRIPAIEDGTQTASAAHASAHPSTHRAPHVSEGRASAPASAGHASETPSRFKHHVPTIEPGQGSPAYGTGVQDAGDAYYPEHQAAASVRTAVPADASSASYDAGMQESDASDWTGLEGALASSAPAVDGAAHAQGSVDGASYSRQDHEVAGRYRDQRKKRRRKRIVAVFAFLVLTMFALGSGAVYAYTHYLNEQLSTGIDDAFRNSLSDADVVAGDPFYALLLGVDSDENRISGTEAGLYEGDHFRSDTIILARVDPKQKQVTLVSFHRDIMVDLSKYGGTGQDKLNSAYGYGGPDLIVRTIENLSGVQISHYAQVDIDGLADIVDTLGGVTVDVPMSFYDPMLEGGLQAGEQKLNGDQALIFCRARHAYDAIGDGDRYRARNQRLFLEALAHQVLASDFSTTIQAINTTTKYVKTDLSVSDITALAKQMQGMDTSNAIYSGMTPTSSQLVGDTWYEVLDKQAFAKMMQRVGQGLPPTESGDDENIKTIEELGTISPAAAVTSPIGPTTISVRNGSGISGVARAAADRL